MAKKVKQQSIKVAKLSSFLKKHRNKSVNVSITQKNMCVNIHGEVHRHDNQFWITQGSARTILEMTQRGGFLSKLLSWPDKRYNLSVTITLSGETVADMTLPMRSQDKLPFKIG
ncbi:hypothetical protein CSA57_06685 [candidate division KSB3 bacterium]|nr:MAG: hypothetical protein CSA57_06685 [candidate division KSB3 bacterium]